MKNELEIKSEEILKIFFTAFFTLCVGYILGNAHLQNVAYISLFVLMAICFGEVFLMEFMERKKAGHKKIIKAVNNISLGIIIAIGIFISVVAFIVGY